MTTAPEAYAGDDDQPRPARGGRRRLWVALAALVLLVATALTAYQLGRASSVPPENGVDVGFARDMQTHHHQAVDLAMLLTSRTGDEDLRTLAYDIATSQAQQSGQLYGWLVQWGLPQTGDDELMGWMEDVHHGGSTAGRTREQVWDEMGMATPAQVAELRGLRGRAADRLFLTLMIRHHEGGVAMAEVAADRAQTDEVRTLARSVLVAQQGEIALMTDLLAHLPAQ